MEYLHPIFEVRQKKMYDLIFIVIKQLCVPRAVVTALSLVEKLILGPVKAVKTLVGIFNGMGMNHVEKNGYPLFMCGIDKLFQIV